MSQIIERCIDCRGSPAESVIKWECLPVRTFGGLPSGRLKAVTVGLNPAFDDWLKGTLEPWRDSAERAAILSDYKKTEREDLTDKDCADAIRRRGEYFWNPNKKWHPYFDSMEGLLARIDRRWSYIFGTVAHVDLIACPTMMRFKLIPDAPRNALLKNCEKYFSQTIKDLPQNTVLLLSGDLAISSVQKFGQIEARKPNESINVSGLSGFSGVLQLPDKRFVFCWWNRSASRLSPLVKLHLAFWVRDQLKNQGVRFD